MEPGNSPENRDFDVFGVSRIIVQLASRALLVWGGARCRGRTISERGGHARVILIFLGLGPDGRPLTLQQYQKCKLKNAKPKINSLDVRSIPSSLGKFFYVFF